MADQTLEEALLGLNYSPLDTTYGVVGNVLAKATPQLLDPNASPWQNLGVSLGSALISSLLGYEADKAAFRRSIETQDYASKLAALTTPEARTSFLSALPEETIGTGQADKLLKLSSALTRQESLSKALINQELIKQEALAKFNLGPLGTELSNRELAKAMLIARAGRTGSITKDWWEKIPAAQKDALTGVTGQVKQLRDLAAQFRQIDNNAVELNMARQIPGSKTDLALSAMQTLVPSTVKMLGDSGALAGQEQEAIKKATLGGRLSGSQSIAARLDQLANLAEAKQTSVLEQYKLGATGGGEAVLQQLKQGAPSQGLTDEQKRNAELKARLAELRALLTQRK